MIRAGPRGATDIPSRTGAVETERTPRPAYRPPAPRPVGDLRTALRVLLQRRTDILQAFSRRSYEVQMGRQGLNGRSIFIVNDPRIARDLMVDRVERFPKASLFSEVLGPLVGEGAFVANGETWRRRRDAIKPAFSHIALRSAFPHMQAAVDAACARLDASAASGDTFELDAEMSHAAADVIFRTLFSEPIDTAAAQEVFEAFARFQLLSDQIRPRRLILASRPLTATRMREVEEVSRRIRDLLGQRVDARRAALAAGAPPPRDMAQAIIDARDPHTGAALDREALIDELAVFFMAGHDTTASTLTWAWFMVSQRPDVAARLRAEHSAAVDEEGGIGFRDAQEQLPFTRAVVREALRLYPPISFLARSPLVEERVRRWTVGPRDILVVSPWTMGRHRGAWSEPEMFDPDRFLTPEGAAAGAEAQHPFGMGPRVCPGQAFAMLESVLVLSRLAGRFDLRPLAPGRVRAAGRVTVRPDRAIRSRVRRWEAA